MPDFLAGAIKLESPVPVREILVRLCVAAIFGFCVAGIYRVSHGRDDKSGVLASTLILLSVLIAMVSMVIGDSVARAFSLVGALSIVRFRTVVEDTRDTAFVIFAVVAGMAAGAGQVTGPLIGIPLVAFIAIMLSWWGRPAKEVVNGAEATLIVRVGLGRDPVVLFKDVFPKRLEFYRLRASSTARQGSALNLEYRVRVRSEVEIASLVTELNQIDGVESVELRV